MSTFDSVTLHSPPWRDPRRLAWIAAWVVPLLPWIGLGLFQATGNEWVWWIGPLVLYGLVPLLDQWLGEDPANPPAEAMQQLSEDPYYRWVLYAWLPLQLLALALACWVVSQWQLGWVGWVGLIATTGLVAGGGINVAHELGHKREASARWLAKLTLAPALYGHFFVEHNRGHHVRVATPEDPASARLGESFWRFLPRTLVGSLRSAWRLETERLSRQGHGAWHWRNENLQAWSLSLLLFAALIWLFGWIALPLLLLQAAYGSMTLESVNYIEHYGLLRQRGADGRYERCQPCHSWNSNRRLTNLMLYQLERHSDHHAHPLRPYQVLRHFDDSPQLPAGYAALVPLAYLPPVWFWLMDRRVLAFYGGDRQRCNLGLTASPT
ncbi:alkane 1-monooxygenase [Pseudomarimonas arenosa]|uniref:Alkane 1-monooxygenase n=1 Tax=Pseudomarimonas arenosa TaxID=2774145 RepID=A0AAW3ZQ97_9GAMM|nr:alkane 1-monooxygenase [Pseudomarimonas arenosa]MBD8526461.1 alkane 1-monooxygenase [Pseudomarimonas arenosa]